MERNDLGIPPGSSNLQSGCRIVIGQHPADIGGNEVSGTSPSHSQGRPRHHRATEPVLPGSSLRHVRRPAFVLLERVEARLTPVPVGSVLVTPIPHLTPQFPTGRRLRALIDDAHRAPTVVRSSQSCSFSSGQRTASRRYPRPSQTCRMRPLYALNAPPLVGLPERRRTLPRSASEPVGNLLHWEIPFPPSAPFSSRATNAARSALTCRNDSSRETRCLRITSRKFSAIELTFQMGMVSHRRRSISG